MIPHSSYISLPSNSQGLFLPIARQGKKLAILGSYEVTTPINILKIDTHGKVVSRVRGR